MRQPLEFAQKLGAAYTGICKPLCHELKLPQTAFDILMFLANNPEYQTASDIVELRKIKANLVSVNVDRLVTEGYLKREALDGDRRKTKLLCTEKAKPIVEKGRMLQEIFFRGLIADIPAEQMKSFSDTLEKMNANLDTLAKKR